MIETDYQEVEERLTEFAKGIGYTFIYEDESGDARHGQFKNNETGQSDYSILYDNQSIEGGVMDINSFNGKKVVGDITKLFNKNFE